MQFTSLVELVAKATKNNCPVEITADSRTVTKGAVFVAIPGTTAHGNTFIEAALDAGAAFIIYEDAIPMDAPPMVRAAKLNVPMIASTDARKALWQLAMARYETHNLAQRGIRVIGITGTNGKTTTAYVLEHLFTALGYKVGVMGTVSYRWPGHEQVAPLTTPDSVRIHAMLNAMIHAQVNVVIMEVSSHALEQDRVGGIEFSAAIFSNLTQDHLDYHSDMQNYFAAKAKLFLASPVLHKVMAINVDDAWGRILMEQCSDALAFGLEARSYEKYLHGEILSMSTQGLHMQMRWKESIWQLQSPLVGAFNASNLLAVQGIALGLGVEPLQLQALENFYGVCGRLERVDNVKKFAAFVDYAHTPDALVNVLKALRGTGFTKIITVFGCGGDRDRTKRPLMGEAVAMGSDVAVLTSDNPRNEDPQAIINDVLPGLKEREGLEILVEVDRRTATYTALQLLCQEEYANAAVLIAGKGHEDYQIIQGVKHPYSDQKTVQEIALSMQEAEGVCA